MWLEETCPSFSTLPFEFELTSQLLMTRVHLLTLRDHPSLRPKWKHASCVKGWSSRSHWFHLFSWTPSSLLVLGDELNDFSPFVIPVKMEGLGWLPPFSLWNTYSLGTLSFRILLNTQRRCYDVDGCNISNTAGFELDVAWSLPSLLASSAMMYWASDCLSLHRLEIFTNWNGM